MSELPLVRLTALSPEMLKPRILGQHHVADGGPVKTGLSRTFWEHSVEDFLSLGCEVIVEVKPSRRRKRVQNIGARARAPEPGWL